MEHINLLEATSAKASKGSDKFLLGVVGVMAASAAVVGGVVGVLSIINNNYVQTTKSLENEIKALEPDLAIVDERTQMLQGFTSYNNTIQSVVNLYNYTPKVTSQVFDKLREPLKTENKLLNENEMLEIESVVISGNEIVVSYKGCSRGDPSSVPARLTEYMTNKVLNKYNDPYFNNVVYMGFTKENVDEYGTYAILASDGETLFDTVFSFQLTMTLPMGSDEEHADIDLGNLDDLEITPEVTE